MAENHSFLGLVVWPERRPPPRRQAIIAPTTSPTAGPSSPMNMTPGQQLSRTRTATVNPATFIPKRVPAIAPIAVQNPRLIVLPRRDDWSVCALASPSQRPKPSQTPVLRRCTQSEGLINSREDRSFLGRSGRWDEQVEGMTGPAALRVRRLIGHRTVFRILFVRAKGLHAAGLDRCSRLVRREESD